ncbi:uncharacterized protein LOC143806687 [Ranitomeya variabilis]|uniref:uncharacterized protein LOC143806687 n=1 Tax=Ranitomeya variabilis TaxID=490064 RepID=UPI004056C6B9
MEPKRNTAASPTAHRTHSVGSVYSERNLQSRLSGLSFTLLTPGFPSGFCEKSIQKKRCKTASKIHRAHMALSIQDVQDMHSHFIFYLQISAITVWIMLGISMIVMGGLYKNDCLIQPKIPIFLLGTGVTHVVISTILLLRILRHLFSVCLDNVMFVLIFCWFAAGSFWIFNMFDQKEGKCATNLYLFAYGVMTFEWIVLWLACIFYFCCSKPKGPTTQENIETGELTGSP